MNSRNRKRRAAGTLRFILLALFILALQPASAGESGGDDTALFWSVSRDGEIVGYLLGTIHSEDPRVLDFSAELSDLMSTNQVFAMEMVPDLPTLQQLTDYMQFQDGTTIEDLIGPQRYQQLRTALAGYRVPADWIARMKVWAAMMTLSVPPPETGFFMDFSLSLRAAGAGLKVVGLETLEQQLAFLEDMPMEQQVALLDQALQEYHKVGELHEQMVDSYLAGNLQALSEQAEEQLGGLDSETRDYFMHYGIEMRNQRMIESLSSLLQSSRVFTAVGALHLPGENGLIRLLRDRGYELRPLPLPFSAAAPESARGTGQRQSR